MIRLLAVISIGLCVGLVLPVLSFAACGGGPTVFTCDNNPPNPDPTGVQEGNNDEDLTIIVLPGAGINTSGIPTDAIDVGRGMNTISINDATIESGSDRDGIDTNGNTTKVMTVEVNNSSFLSCFNCIDTTSGPANITIIGSNLTSTGNGDTIRSSSQNDEIFIQDSVLLAGPSGDGIDSGSGNDQITVINSLIEAVQAGRDDDTVTMGTEAEIDGLIDCGLGTDSLVFGMTVFPEQIAEISAEIADSDPSGGTIIIAGNTYEWQNCEALVNELVPGIPGRVTPIPTLSQWGMIAMAGVIGIVGLLFAVRRRSSAGA